MATDPVASGLQMVGTGNKTQAIRKSHALKHGVHSPAFIFPFSSYQTLLVPFLLSCFSSMCPPLYLELFRCQHYWVLFICARAVCQLLMPLRNMPCHHTRVNQWVSLGLFTGVWVPYQLLHYWRPCCSFPCQPVMSHKSSGGVEPYEPLLLLWRGVGRPSQMDLEQVMVVAQRIASASIFILSLVFVSPHSTIQWTARAGRWIYVLISLRHHRHPGSVNWELKEPLGWVSQS